MEIINREVIEKTKQLELVDEHYAVFGSAILDVLGIRKSADIDLIVTNNLYEQLINSSDWKKIIYENGDEAVKYNGNIEGIDVAFYYCNWIPSCDKKSIETMIKNSVKIDGVSFTSLEDTIQWKQRLGRDKDIKDVKLIKEWIKTHEI